MVLLNVGVMSTKLHFSRKTRHRLKSQSTLHTYSFPPSLSMYITLSYDNMHAVFSIHPLGVSVDSTAMYLTTNSYLTHPLSLSLMYITISYYDIHVHAVFSIYPLGVSVDSTVMYLTTTSCSEPIAFNPSPRTNLTRTSEMTPTFVCVTMTCLSVVSLR